MAATKNNIYKKYQNHIKDKDTAVLGFIENTLAKTQSMFQYEGLPETIPATELERILQTDGAVFVTEVSGDLYALSGALGGEPDEYNRPTIFTVVNNALRLNKNYSIKDDGVLIMNDTNGNGLLDIIGKYAVLYTDSLISLNTASILTRITMLISASDDKTKQSAEMFLQKILDGDFSIIGENAFFKGVNMQTAPTTNSVYISQLIELVQYVKASMCNEIGLNANYNMKRERLNTSEVSMNVDALLPYVDNMLKQRTDAIQKINERYGTDIKVNFASSWKLERDNFDSLETSYETLQNNAAVTGADGTETEPTGAEPEPDGTDNEPDGTDTEQTGADTEQTGADAEQTGADADKEVKDGKEVDTDKEPEPDKEPDTDKEPETDKEPDDDKKKTKKR